MYNAIFFTDVTDHLVSIPAIGSYKLAHVLRKNGYTALVVTHLSDYTKEELKELLDKTVTSETALVGFSTTFVLNTETFENSVQFKDIDTTLVFPQGKQCETEIIAYIKEKCGAKIVVGGTKVHPQYANKNIDYVSLGYSEASIVNLMNHLTKGDKLEHATKNIYGRVVIDDRTAKSYDFANEDMQWLPTDVVNHKCLPIEIGRGCIFKCKFCSYPMNGKQNLDFVKSPALLRKELQDNYDNYGVESYIIVDDTFNDHIEKLKAIEEVVSKLTFKPIFWAYIRLDLICTRPESLDVLYNIGLRAMHFGIESFTPAAAKGIGKGYNTNKQIEMIAHIKEKYPDIILHASLIIGLPGESMVDVLNISRRLINKEIKLDSWHWNPLMIEKPGTVTYTSEFSRDYASSGFVDQATNDDEYTVNWKTDYMTRDEAVELSDLVNNDSMWNSDRTMSGYSSIQLASYGLKFEEIGSVRFKDFPFHKIQKELKPKHAAEYKAKLLELINANS